MRVDQVGGPNPAMDRIRLTIDEKEFPHQGRFPVTEIWINDRNLIDIIREIELPVVLQKGGSPESAGVYAGLDPEIMFLPSKHLLGEPAMKYQRDGRPFVLGCGCGVPDCGPVTAKIEIDKDIVIWRDFNAKPDLKFVFDRKQYESELSKTIE